MSLSNSLEEKLSQAITAGNLLESAKEHIQAWLTQEKYALYWDELSQLIENEEWEILNDSFFTILPFGTGGRRGTVGIGPNRINEITIGESAQGLADYLKTTDATNLEKGIAIAYDTRTTSKEFAHVAAGICQANGFTVYLFPEFRATPELSFAVRHLNAAAGIVISASHNPPQDNGFKVYWSDGGQLVSPHAEKLTEYVGKVTKIHQRGWLDEEASGRKEFRGAPPERSEGGGSGTDWSRERFIETGPERIAEIDKAYITAVLAESLSKSRSAQIVYSPLHGTGVRSVLPVLQEAGFAVSLVEEQATPDGNFPTVPKNSPNPENIQANDIATNQAETEHADIAITTDPDADRLGVIAPDKNGTFHLLTGNQIAALAGQYVLEQMKASSELTSNHFIAKTIVTTDLLSKVANDYGVTIYEDLLIGFKYIGELIAKHQDNGGQTFILGGEESYGFLKGSYARDKDAAVAALMIAELASQLKDKNMTLINQLHMLYKTYGIFEEQLSSTYYEGAKGNSKMDRIMQQLRDNPPGDIAGHKVVRLIDRQDAKHGTPGNVLIFHISDDGHRRLTIRPSGTEPKIKIYTQFHQEVSPDISDEDLTNALQQAHKEAEKITKAFQKILE